MGKFYDLIQAHIDAQPYHVPDRQVAGKLGVTQTTLSNWRTPKRLIDKQHLLAVARLTGVPYLRVLDALLEDIGYLREESDGDDRSAAPMNVTELSDALPKVADEQLGRVAKRPKKQG